MSDEVEKRIEAARQEGERTKQVKEFMESLTKNDELVRPVYNPEAYVMREKYRAAASRGEIENKGCTHPLISIQQYVDEDPLTTRGGPVNLFACGICHMPLWLVDPWGNPLADD